MFTVQKSRQFSAAHSLRGYDGPCARVHGHDYRVVVEVRGESLDDQKLLVDFFDLDRYLKPLIAKVDHQYLNEIPPFTEVNPTAEAIAAWFHGELKQAFAARPDARVALAAVHIWETPDSCASYSEDD